MHLRYSIKYGKNIQVIYPGEYYVSDQDELIGTVLGSCVTLCLYDPVIKIAGMNHFMLPGKIVQNDIFSDRSARYGITAVNQLLSAIIEKGACKENLTAKIFGGGVVLHSTNENVTFPVDNIRVAKILMEMEDIPVIVLDVGEKYTRKLLLNVKNGKVFLKKTLHRQSYQRLPLKNYQHAKRGCINE